MNRDPESWLVEDLTSLLENLEDPHECENLCLFFPSLTLIEPTKLTELIEIENFLCPSHNIENIHILTYAVPETIMSIFQKINQQQTVKIYALKQLENEFKIELNENSIQTAFTEFYSLDFFH